MAEQGKARQQSRNQHKLRQLSLLPLVILLGANCAGRAQSTPSMVVTGQTTLASYTYPPPVNNNALLQGAGFGTLAVDKLGDVFVGAYNSNAVYEFPASGAAPVAVYLSSSSGHAGAVALDPNENLVVSERFNNFIYLIPYLNGGYTPYTYSSSTTPPNCVPSPKAACNYDSSLLTYQNGIKGSVTGYYYQPIALAFDAQGNSYIATAYDNEGSNNIYECTVACNYNGANNASLLYHHSTFILSIAVDAAGDVFFADGTNTLYEVKVGSKTPTAVSTSFNQAQGVSFDSAGNLYVSDFGTTAANANAGIYEIPLEAGELNPADTFMVLPLIFTTPNSGYDSPDNIGTIGIAVDQRGNVFATQGYNNLTKYTVDNASLPGTALSSTSAPTMLTVAFDKAVSLKGVSFSAAGVASTEFGAITSGKTAGTCTFGTAYKPAESCTLAVTFTPAKPGLRTGVMTVTDSDGDAAQVLLSGVGVGQGLTVDPGTQSTLGASLKSPESVAVDAAGNVFVADAASDSVYEFAGGKGSGTTVGSGLKQPGGVAVDAAGNLYISDTGNDRVVMISNSGGTLVPSTQTTLLSDVKSPGQLAVDTGGTLFIPETGNNDMFAFVTRSGLGSGALRTEQMTGLSSPSAVTTDALGRIYISDTGNNRVVQLSDGAISTVGSALSSPAGVTLDGSGSVIIADQGNGRIVRVPNEKGVLTASDQLTINTSVASPHSVQVDASGNLYATDNTNGVVYSIDRGVGSIGFGRVNGGGSSVEETAVLASSGPADLTFKSPLYAPLPANSPFQVTSPAPSGCDGMKGLDAGTTCTLDTEFAPSKSVEGEQNYSLSFNTGAQNTSSASLQLSGDAVNLTVPAVTLTKTEPSSGPINYGMPVTVQASVTRVSGVFGTPTGTIVFILDGANGQPLTLDTTGAASLTFKGLSGGTHTVAATYSGDSHYAPEASKAITITILPDASSTSISIVGYSVNPLSAEPPNPTNTGDTVTMTATVVPSIQGALSGTVVFSSGGTPVGSAILNGTTVGSSTVYTAVLTINTLAEGNYNVIATFTGNSNYSTSASTSIPLIITPPKFVLSESATSISSSQNNPGTATISVTSYAGFTGGVDFSCSGLPAHATCQFVPDELSLTTTGSIPINVPVLSTQLTVLVDQPPLVTPTGIFWWSGLLLGLGLFGIASNRRARRRLWMHCAATILVFGSLVELPGCGGNATFTTPTGASTVTITATASPTGVTNGKSDVVATIPFTLNVH